MKPEYIISTLYNPNEADIEASLKLIDDLEDVSDLELFSKVTLDRLIESNQIYQYICSLFSSCSKGSEILRKRRLFCCYHAISVIKLGIGGPVTECIERLASNILILNERDIENIINRILMEFLPSSEQSLANCASLIELLPRLICRLRGDIKAKVISRIIEMKWHPLCVNMFSSVLCEVCEEEIHCCLALDAVASHIQWNMASFVQHSNKSMKFGSDAMVEADDLPNLFYHITLLGKIIETSSLYHRKVVSVLSASLDKLVFPLVYEQTDVSVGSNDSIRQRYQHNEIFKRKVDDIFANIIHHLSMIFARDQHLTGEVFQLVKNRWLFSAIPSSTDGTETLTNLSAGKLLLCCISSQASHLKDKLNAALVELVHEVYSVKHDEDVSMWYQAPVWHSAMSLGCTQVWCVFESFCSGPMYSEMTIATLIHFSFSLIDQAKSPSWVKIFSERNAYEAASSSNKYGVLPAYLGFHLLSRIFDVNIHIRSLIVKEICARLCAIISDQTDRSAALVNFPSILCINLLAQLSLSNPLGVIESGSDLLELFASITSLNHDLAGKLIDALSPMFSLSRTIAERCSIALRKVSFSKESFCRKSAISALLQLLSYQLLVEMNDEYSNSNSNTFSLSIDEILVLLKRFLQYQPAVRAIFYHKVSQFSALFPAFRPYGIRMLRTHLTGYFGDGISTEAINRYQISISNCCPTQKLVEPIGTLMLTLVSFLVLPAEAAGDSVCFDATSDAFMLSQLPMSQSMLTQSDNVAQAVVRNEYESTEVRLTTKLLWKAIRNACDADLDSYGIKLEAEADCEENAVQFCRCDALFQYFLGCLAALLVVKAPNGPEEVNSQAVDRLFINISQKLCQLIDALTAKAAKIRTSEDSSKRSKKKQKVSERCDVSAGVVGADDDVLGAAIGAEDGANQNVRRIIKSNSEALSWYAVNICKEHLPSMGIGSLSTATPFSAVEISCLARGYEIIHRMTDSEDILLSKRVIHMFHIKHTAHLLENILHHYGEANIDIDSLLAIPVIRSNSKSADAAVGYSNANWTYSRNWQLQIDHVSELLKELFKHLVIDLIDARKAGSVVLVAALEDTNTKKRGRQASGKAVATSRPRIILTNLLNCLHINIRLERLKLIHCDATGNNGRLEIVYLAIVRMLADAFRPMSKDSASSDRGGEESLIPFVKQFFMLLLSIQKAEEDDVSTCEWKSEAPILVAIIGELVDVMLPAERTKISNRIYNECENKISNPSPELACSLIRFFLLVGPNNPAERLTRALEIAYLFQQCSEEEVQRLAAREEADDADFEDNGKDADIGKCFVLMNSKCLPSVAALLASLLEKAVAETANLLKLRERGSVTKRKQLRNIASELIGRIDSDEEEEAINRGSVREGSKLVNVVADSNSEIECITLKRIFEVVLCLISATYISPSSEKILMLIVKLYKLQVKITKTLSQEQCSVLPRMYRVLAEFTANKVHEKLQEYISAVHLDTSAKSAKQAKLVPELIYQMEQLDVALIKLSSSIVDKQSVRKLIKRSAARDFKIDLSRHDELEGEPGRMG